MEGRMKIFLRMLLAACASYLSLSGAYAAGGKVGMVSQSSGSFAGVASGGAGYSTGEVEGVTSLNFKNGASFTLYAHCEYYVTPSISDDVEGWCQSFDKGHSLRLDTVFTCNNIAAPTPTSPIPNRKCTATVAGGTGLFSNASGSITYETTTTDWSIDWVSLWSKGEGVINY